MDASLPDLESTDLAARSRFNFSYLNELQDGAQSIAEWNQDGKKDASLEKLLLNLKVYSTYPLSHWINERRLTIYGRFPKEKSEFKHPVNVPHEVFWGRFRLAGKVHLAGFVIPSEFEDTEFTTKELHTQSKCLRENQAFHLLYR
ncbi:hypothetical protein NFHSH190041_15830 [Shewanella sp. NFH-SH190041]|uniref:hypothetical protein n=1 Tax=Shewanella sp. NFH-SH190041 TaxID=2950245 RepID=UPI0021C49AB9|nr:hypothetical protein [Shewanella sp. NFH-SH190041]BDM64131.1 hypothetical protein NFHSH190041_15830 [Shewanella sp. NFH-SH190041]